MCKKDGLAPKTIVVELWKNEKKTQRYLVPNLHQPNHESTDVQTNIEKPKLWCKHGDSDSYWRSVNRDHGKIGQFKYVDTTRV